MEPQIQSQRGEMEAVVDSTMLQLVEIVKKEVEAFQELLDTMESEQSALVMHDLEGIEAAVARQREIAEEAGALERTRVRLITEISEELGESTSELTLKRLIERIQGPESQRLGEMRETLMGMHEKVQNANRHNALLINQSMKYVDKSLQILTGEGPQAGVYKQTGKVSKSTGRAVLNQVV